MKSVVYINIYVLVVSSSDEGGVRGQSQGLGAIVRTKEPESRPGSQSQGPGPESRPEARVKAWGQSRVGTIPWSFEITGSRTGSRDPNSSSSAARIEKLT